MVKFEEMVGKGKAEEETERGYCGAQWGAVEQSSGNVPSFLFFFQISNYLFNHTPLLLNEFAASFFQPEWDILLYVWACLTYRWVIGR